MGEIDVYGFDYDYTLVNYTDELAHFIFDTTIDYLISKLKVGVSSFFQIHLGYFSSILLIFEGSGMIRTSSFEGYTMILKR